MPTPEEVNIILSGFVSQTSHNAAISALTDEINALKAIVAEDSVVLKDTEGRKWRFKVDTTGMLSQPGEDLGI
jgi:hypothetical protein